MAEVGRDLWKTSGPVQGHLEPVGQDCLQMAFECLQGGSTTCSVTLAVEPSFLMFRGNLLQFQHVPTVLSLGTAVKSLAPSLHSPSWYYYVWISHTPPWPKLCTPSSLSVYHQPLLVWDALFFTQCIVLVGLHCRNRGFLMLQCCSCHLINETARVHIYSGNLWPLFYLCGCVLVLMVLIGTKETKKLTDTLPFKHPES